jgi:hypothetical protein
LRETEQHHGRPSRAAGPEGQLRPPLSPIPSECRGAGQPFHLVAPFETDPTKWPTGDYVDIYSRQTYAISTETYDETTALVQTYRQIAIAYIRHPDAKRLAADGQACGNETRGLLSPRHIDAFHVEQLGKEANRLDEVQAGLVHEADEVYTRYQQHSREPFARLALPVLNTVPRSELLVVCLVNRW